MNTLKKILTIAAGIFIGVAALYVVSTWNVGHEDLHEGTVQSVGAVQPKDHMFGQDLCAAKVLLEGRIQIVEIGAARCNVIKQGDQFWFERKYGEWYLQR